MGDVIESCLDVDGVWDLFLDDGVLMIFFFLNWFVVLPFLCFWVGWDLQVDFGLNFIFSRFGKLWVLG